MGGGFLRGRRGITAETTEVVVRGGVMMRLKMLLGMLIVRRRLEINGANRGIDENLDVAKGRSQLRVEVCVAKVFFSGKSAGFEIAHG